LEDLDVGKNQLSSLPAEIGQLRAFDHLDASNEYSWFFSCVCGCVGVWVCVLWPVIWIPMFSFNLEPDIWLTCWSGPITAPHNRKFREHSAYCYYFTLLWPVNKIIFCFSMIRSQTGNNTLLCAECIHHTVYICLSRDWQLTTPIHVTTILSQ
jgi:hypothetical protein